ncbi:TIGR02391 family protein [Curtobacterium sp. A7_M15]|uniref:TIGR02391 family protein n=1 Tax=Curtobacterium sp. A7_M15 TaxID=3065241 RepID=UPI002737EE71|nr:TIGR02391 family protein [Curtobacterium sp. A7_M15]MDP4332389.1 TIGR02391 family protein [Curtobacterium sp. A7_M15]
MDVNWALEQLENYLTLMERVPLPPEERRSNKKSRTRGTEREIKEAEHVVSAIGQAVYAEPPRWVSRDLVMRLRWELTQGDEVRRRLGLDGPPPAYSGESMHPWVWDAASPHWSSGNFDAAVWAAGVNVNSRLQKKTGRKDLGEAKLLAESFSTEDPVPGRPRLRLVDQSNPDLFKDVHVGASLLGRGLYSAVRNTINHVGAEVHGFGETESMEALAGFSLLSRWIERADLEEGSLEP